ncbi:MAG: 6-bladed beta-propeller [Bacteroidetes bacterium]|nr:6-bladed beta-propeller [Bacteroidota bacterium]
MQLQNIAYAQNDLGKDNFQNGDINYVKYINQFPSIDKGKSSNFFEKVTDFIIGEKETPLLIKPMSVIAINPDSFQILDQGNGLVFQIQNQESEIPKFFKKRKDKLTSLVGICENSTKDVLITDSKLNKIFKISADKKSITILNDSLKLNQPTGISFSNTTKEIWVVETGAHQISILDENGNLKKTIGKRGTQNSEFNFPTYLSFDKKGNAYVVDAMNFRIQIFDKSGNFVSTFGEIGDATGYFSRPKGIAIDSTGNIYIVDALFNTVQIFDNTGAFLYQFGKQGQNKEEFWMPTGIFIDKKDYIYVADSYNARVQIFQHVYEKGNEKSIKN